MIPGIRVHKYKQKMIPGIRVYKYKQKHNQTQYTNFNERTNTLLYKNIISHIWFSKGWWLLCVRDDLETGTDCYIEPSLSRDHSSTSSSSWLVLLNRWSLRAQSPLSAAGSHFDILSPTDSNRQCTWSYCCLTSTCSRCSFAYLHRCISWLTARSRVSI